MRKTIKSISYGATLMFVALYISSGTLAMGIVYHQHRGHIMGWLAGDEVAARVIVQQPVAQRDECEQAYGISCRDYTMAIAESGKEAKKSVWAVLDKGGK